MQACFFKRCKYKRYVVSSISNPLIIIFILNSDTIFEFVLSHERAWLKNDIYSVQIQAVLEVADAESARELERVIREKYEKVEMGSYGLS